MLSSKTDKPKFSKAPRDAKNYLVEASWLNPATYSTFLEACNAVASDGWLSGIGLMLGSGVGGCDFDGASTLYSATE